MVNSLSTPTVTVDNVTVFIIPNSFKYTEGFGEQTVRAQSAGGGSVRIVSSDNAEMKISDPKWSMLNTNENIDIIRAWKAKGSNIAISATDKDGFTRTFNNATLVNNYEVNLAADGTIDLEWKSEPAV